MSTDSHDIIARYADHDAVVVGASLAGCTTAALLAREGARVALVERRPDAQAFKRMCSHFIQSSAVPTLDRLGLLERIEREGGVRSRFRAWTRWGWITPPPTTAVPAGVNLRRERLDPLVRELAAETPGVELILGAKVDRLLFDGDRVCGVQATDRTGSHLTLRAPLVVGADGRDSHVAEMAKVRLRRSGHRRFAYAGYFEGPAPEGAPDATLWFLDPHWAAAFPTDAGLTLYGAMPTKDRLEDFRRDPERALVSFVADLPDAPPIRQSRLVGPVLGKLDMPNVLRGPTAPGLALVGDAALATDPLWGVGCGWAFQSGEWLADSVAPALRGEQALERGLRSYRRRFRRELVPHATMIHEYARGRRLNAPERLLYSGATRDERLAELFEAFGTRNIGPLSFLARALPRALVVAARTTAAPRQRQAAIGTEARA